MPCMSDQYNFTGKEKGWSTHLHCQGQRSGKIKLTLVWEAGRSWQWCKLSEEGNHSEPINMTKVIRFQLQCRVRSSVHGTDQLLYADVFRLWNDRWLVTRALNLSLSWMQIFTNPGTQTGYTEKITYTLNKPKQIYWLKNFKFQIPVQYLSRCRT